MVRTSVAHPAGFPVPIYDISALVTVAIHQYSFEDRAQIGQREREFTSEPDHGAGCMDLLPVG